MRENTNIISEYKEKMMTDPRDIKMIIRKNNSRAIKYVTQIKNRFLEGQDITIDK